MRLSEILRCEVLTESGERLGHVFDVRVRRRAGSSSDRADQEWRVQGLVVGRRGLRERLGVTNVEQRKPTLTHTLVPWERVIGLAAGRVTVKDGTTLE